MFSNFLHLLNIYYINKNRTSLIVHKYLTFRQNIEELFFFKSYRCIKFLHNYKNLIAKMKSARNSKDLEQKFLMVTSKHLKFIGDLHKYRF